MTSEPISQAEIDALLNRTQQAADGAAPGGPGRPGGNADRGGSRGGAEWSGLQAAAAAALEGAWAVAPALLGTPAQLGEVQVLTMTAGEASGRFGPEPVWGRVTVADSQVYILLPEALALQVIGLMLGGLMPGELNATGTAALAEALGQLTGKAMARLAAQAGWPPGMTPVEVIPAAAAAAAGLPAPEAALVVVQHPVQLGPAAGGSMGLALPLDAGRRLAGGLRAPAGGGGAPRPDVVSPARPAAPESAPAQWHRPPAAAQARAPEPAGAVGYQAAQFRDLAGTDTGQGPPRNIDLLMDVSLQVTVELGRTRKQIREVLSIGPGSVVELEKLAGEPVDVLVNGKLIARGEVVVIDEHFGVRITDIISPAERAATLGR